MVRQMALIAFKTGLELNACCSPFDFSDLSVQSAACIDADRLKKITGRVISHARDTGQRPGCHCARSVDIGTYRTCRHGCRYCYAG